MKIYIVMLIQIFLSIELTFSASASAYSSERKTVNVKGIDIKSDGLVVRYEDKKDKKHEFFQFRSCDKIKDQPRA